MPQTTYAKFVQPYIQNNPKIKFTSITVLKYQPKMFIVWLELTLLIFYGSVEKYAHSLQNKMANKSLLTVSLKITSFRSLN